MTYSIRDAAWIIADHLAPPDVADNAARRAAADKARKRIIYAAARPDALFAIVAGTIERDGFLRWAALTYPGYRPPLDQMQPITGTGHSSLSFSASGTGFTLAPPSDDDLKAAWFDAERRAFELQRKLDEAQARIAELEGEVSKLREADRKRREAARANARRPRNL
jgi:hypothetical protein